MLVLLTVGVAAINFGTDFLNTLGYIDVVGAGLVTVFAFVSGLGKAAEKSKKPTPRTYGRRV